MTEFKAAFVDAILLEQRSLTETQPLGFLLPPINMMGIWITYHYHVPRTSRLLRRKRLAPDVCENKLIGYIPRWKCVFLPRGRHHKCTACLPMYGVTPCVCSDIHSTGRIRIRPSRFPPRWHWQRGSGPTRHQMMDIRLVQTPRKKEAVGLLTKLLWP